jgi:hypothetical protein
MINFVKPVVFQSLFDWHCFQLNLNHTWNQMSTPLRIIMWLHTPGWLVHTQNILIWHKTLWKIIFNMWWIPQWVHFYQVVHWHPPTYGGPTLPPPPPDTPLLLLITFWPQIVFEKRLDRKEKLHLFRIGLEINHSTLLSLTLLNN